MAQVIEQFPVSPGPMVLVCTGDDADTRRSFCAPVLNREIPVVVVDPATPNLGWHPAAKIQVQGRSIGRIMGTGPEIVVDDECKAVAFWLAKAEGLTNATPTDVEWQVRSSSGCAANVLGTGAVHLKDMSETGIIVQVSGYLGNGYELWMRVSSLTANAQVMRLTLEIRASRFHGGPREMWKGSVSI